MTMLGVTVDYPVLLIGHRKQGEAGAGTLRRIGQAFALAVITAALGLTGMLFSGFPGLAQLGLFSDYRHRRGCVSDAVAAAQTDRAADLAPVSAGDPARLLRIERLRRGDALGGSRLSCAVLYLAAVGGPRLAARLRRSARCRPTRSRSMPSCGRDGRARRRASTGWCGGRLRRPYYARRRHSSGA